MGISDAFCDVGLQANMADKPVGLALLGAGVFACAQYVPNFKDLSDVVTLRAVWSRSQVRFVSSELV